MEYLNEISLNELEEMEEMVCLASGGTTNCCFEGEINNTTTVDTDAAVSVGAGSATNGGTQ